MQGMVGNIDQSIGWGLPAFLTAQDYRSSRVCQILRT